MTTTIIFNNVDGALAAKAEAITRMANELEADRVALAETDIAVGGERGVSRSDTWSWV
jgi:hypothetical protein